MGNNNDNFGKYKKMTVVIPAVAVAMAAAATAEGIRRSRRRSMRRRWWRTHKPADLLPLQNCRSMHWSHAGAFDGCIGFMPERTAVPLKKKA